MMGRKGASQQRAMAKEEFEFQRGVTEEQRAERAAGKEQLMPEYLRLYDESFGYKPEGFQAKLFTPRQRERVLTSTISGARLPYEQIEDASRQRLARTRNPAGYGAVASELARGKSRSVADVTRRTEAGLSEKESMEEFRRSSYLEDERLRRRLGGLGGLGSLFGIDTQLLMSQLGRGTQALGAHAAGIEPGLMETLISPLVGGAAAGGSMYAGQRLFG